MFFYIYLIFINIIAFLYMYRDKQRARKNEWRIPERRLWTIAAIGGSVGIWGGMKYFRHKTKHASFRVGTPILIITQIAVVLLILQKL